jgi:hypothetical protein
MTATPSEANQTIDRVLSLLEGVRLSGSTGTKWVAKCPAHNDSRPSLSVSVFCGSISLKCFAGCTQEAILNSLGLTPAQLRIVGGMAQPKQGQGQGRRGSASHPHAALQPYNTPHRLQEIPEPGVLRTLLRRLRRRQRRRHP